MFNTQSTTEVKKNQKMKKQKKQKKQVPSLKKKSIPKSVIAGASHNVVVTVQDVFKNYRPVSNLPFLSKILEKMVLAR